MRILDLEELEEAETCSSVDEEEAWAALGKLAPHLEDPLVLVDHTRAFEGGVCNLTVCQARDAERTPLYVLVGGDGAVRVGRADDLRQAASRYLDAFDPLWHGVISVAVSSAYRPLGDRLDLWIVVRPASQEQAEAPSVAYHGLIWLDDEGAPHVEPSQDDRGGEERRRWLSQAAEKLPDFLRCCNFACPAGTEPLGSIPPEAKGRIDEIEDGHFDQIEVVAWSGTESGERGVLGVAIGGEVSLSHFPEDGTEQRLDIGDRVRALALVGDALDSARGVAAPDARLLVAFAETTEGLREAWRQPVQEFPAGIAFLPPTAASEGGEEKSWPDLLVAFHDGNLQRLRVVGRNRFRGAWSRAWQLLELETADKRIAAVRAARGDESSGRRPAVLLGAVESLVNEAENMSSEVQVARAEEIEELFRPEERFRVLSRALEQLVESFETSIREDRPSWRFLAVLLHRIYTCQSYVAIQDRIDELFRSLPLTEQQQNHPALQVLERRSTITREEIWLQRARPEDAVGLVERSVFGLERWANAYLVEDTLRLGDSPDASPTGLAGLTSTGNQDLEDWVVCSRSTELRAYRLGKSGTLETSSEPVVLTLERDGIRSMAHVPGSEKQKILVAGASGDVYLFAFDPASRSFFRLDHLARRGEATDPGLHASAWAAACTLQGDIPFVAISYNERRQSRVRLLEVSGERLREVAWIPLDIPRVRALDIADDGKGGFLLAAGSIDAGPVRMLTFDRDGTESAARKWFRALKSGTLSLRFSSSLKPTHLLAGERSGLLWCANLSLSSGIGDLTWTYELGAAIRAIERVHFGNEAHFLAGSENGKVVLLRVRDGRRIWKHALRFPVRRIGSMGVHGERVVVAMRSERLAVLSRVQDREKALNEVRHCFKELAKYPRDEVKAVWRTSTAEPVEAVFRLVQGHESPNVLFSRFPARETRAILVRYFAEEIGPDYLRQDALPILRALSLRELMLLLSCLPDTARGWNEAIWEELSHRPLKAAGDDSTRAGMAAVVVFLQRLRGEHREDASSDELQVREDYLKLPWVRLELTRATLLHVRRTLSSDRQKPADLLAATVPWLLQQPPAMVESCASVLRYGTGAGDIFSRFSVMVQALERKGIPRLEDVSALAQALGEVARREPLPIMMANLASLFTICRQKRGKDWREWRQEALGKVRNLERALRDLKGVRPPLRDLVSALRRLLPDPFPEDQETAAQRSAWLRAARRHLDEPFQGETSSEDHSWTPVLRHLILEIRATLDRVVRLETEHVFFLVRPYLHLDELDLRDGSKVVLKLRVEAEGSRPLEDVTILFNASGSSGLHGEGNASYRMDVPQFPSRSANKTLVLSGYLREGQESITVETALEDRTGYRSGDRWLFPIPQNPIRTLRRPSFHSHLPQAYRHFVQSVLTCREPVALAVIDPDLSRDTFIEEWLRRTGGTRILLDDLLRDVGPRRRYSARSLSLEMLERCLRGMDPLEAGPSVLPPVKDPDSPLKPLLVSPADEVFARLIEGEASGLLELWVASLRRRISSSQAPVVIVVSSAHAAQIRGLRSGKLPEIAAHRAVLEIPETSPPRPESLQMELVDLTEKEAGFSVEIARERLETLGWDVRFALRWLRWIKEDKQRKTLPTTKFLEEIHAADLLRAELRALDPIGLVHALVGAEAVTTLELRKVVPGHAAAEDYFSTTRTSAPKLLQRRATLFTERSVQGLQLDQSRIDRIRVQGFGTAGAAQASRTHLLSLALQPAREELERSFQSLARSGIGIFLEGIFRTRPPYRELIQGLYDKAANQPALNPDEIVYGDLKGRERSPLESLTMSEVAKISIKQLAELLQAGQKEIGLTDLRKLQRIGRFWEPTHDEDHAQALTAFFAPEPVRRIEPQTGRWDEPIARLPWPVFGAGKAETGESEVAEYPQEYILWSGFDHAIQVGDLHQIGEASDHAVHLRQREIIKGDDERTFFYPRVLVLGPGTENAPYDPTRRVAILKSADLCHAVWAGELLTGLRRRARVQMRITALSPFQTSGAIPAGSPLFVGREWELSFIKDKIRSASILIIGSRRVGKTSLLNQVDLWAQGEADLVPIFVDLQGCTRPDDFARRLRRAVTAKGIPGNIENLDELVMALSHSRRLPLFLLNEIDGLAERARNFIASWRGLNDRQTARFLMVGYTAVGQIGIPASPFFHFTEGPSFAGKALVLESLSEPAARKLLDLLENSDVQARWATPEDREQSYRLCLDRSYRIPWVLQRFGQLLVEHLERERKDTLTFHDVEGVVEHEGRVVWKYIEGIDYKSLGLGPDASARRPGFQLVLYAVARQKYFSGGRQAPIIDPRLPARSPLAPDLGFTIGEARDIVKDTLSSLLRGRERAVVGRWFEQLDLEYAFRLLTLTMMLEPDPEADRRYGFLLHILPRELRREHGPKDPTLDGLIVKKAVEFIRSIDQGREG